MAIDEDMEALRKISTASSCPTESSFAPLMRRRARLWPSCRLNLALMCLAATLGFFLMRLNLSFALVCMVRQPINRPVNVTTIGNATSSSRPYDLTYDDDQHQEEEEDVAGLDWNKEMQGSMLSAFYYGFGATQIFGGWISDRIAGSKLILIMVMSVMSFISLLSPIAAQSSQLFFALRLLLGLTSGMALPTIQPLFSRWSAPDERGTLIGLAFAGFTLGSSITFPLSGFLCEYGFAGGWPSIFYLSGLFGVVWVVLAIFLIHDSPDTHPRISAEELAYLEPYCLKKQPGKKYNSIPWKGILTSGPVHTINICQFCLNWGFYTLISGLPIFMKEALKFDITQNGLLSSMPYAAALVVHLVAGKFFDWCRAKQFLSVTWLRKIFNTVGFLLPAISFFAVGQLTSEWRYVAVFLLALSQAGSEIAIMGGFMFSNIDLAPQYSGVLQGISNTIGTVPGFVSPIAIAYLTPTGTAGEWANVFYISGSFYVLGAMIYLIFGTSERQKWSHHPTQIITAAAADIDDGKEDARQLFQSPVPSSRPEIS
ncbi:sialin-like [Daphnia pulicaria]|uniref:sialin-like n=1 Tax=Daphnia pulicaria TaxID=35523 RepID=UPI001EEAB78E|nr:sialin-like [Daphnia pulicaria]